MSTAPHIPSARSLAEDHAQKLELLAQHYDKQTSSEDKKALGQFFTPAAIARFIAALIETTDKQLRVLDPGAGLGVLGIVTATSLLQRGAERVHLVAVEQHGPTCQALRSVLHDVERGFGGRLTVEVHEADFLDMDAAGSLLAPRLAPFDVVVSNPPYFKMSPKDGRAGGSTNAYTRFMHAAASLLKPGGQLAFIVPRSFASGYYFRTFRTSFHAEMTLRHVHLFDSRRAVFKEQEVLQENIIALYHRRPPTPDTQVQISTSEGAEALKDAPRHAVPWSTLVAADDPHAVLRLPTDPGEAAFLEACRCWRWRLEDYGLRVSTGPVVPFRAQDLLVSRPTDQPTVPLLWLQHVQPEGVRWPLGATFRKAEHLLRDAPSSLLVPNRCTILLRRLSTREELRRLSPCLLRGDELDTDVLGLENHLNYITRPGGLDMPCALGLTALLASALLDRYFRICNGSTQVNATELEAMPLPSPDATTALGDRLQAHALSSGSPEAEAMIREVFDGCEA